MTATTWDLLERLQRINGSWNSNSSVRIAFLRGLAEYRSNVNKEQNGATGNK
jgi:hypothetical protein